jgi:23S rRNA pseudouridine2605 synthase
MRLNKFIAQSTGLSRRAADNEIEKGTVLINGRKASLGDSVDGRDEVSINGQAVYPKKAYTYIILNKPRGFVASRNGQGSRTVYDLLPEKLHGLKTVGRLDKDSSGLILLTDDGDMANELTHPKKQKLKQYEIVLDKPLAPKDFKNINEDGVVLDDGLSRLGLKQLGGSKYTVSMHEGRNRQIRRTFAAIGYEVKILHRFKFGNIDLGNLKEGSYREIEL